MTLLSQSKPESHHVRPESHFTQLPPPDAEPDGRRNVPASEASLGELTARLSEQVSRLVRDEMALAQVEAKQKAKRLGLGAGMFGVAGGLAFFGAACGVTAAIFGLANIVQPWLAAIIVGALCFLLGLLVALPGWKGIKQAHPVPEDAVESIKADVAAIRGAARHRDHAGVRHD